MLGQFSVREFFWDTEERVNILSQSSSVPKPTQLPGLRPSRVAFALGMILFLSASFTLPSGTTVFKSESKIIDAGTAAVGSIHSEFRQVTVFERALEIVVNMFEYHIVYSASEDIFKEESGLHVATVIGPVIGLFDSVRTKVVSIFVPQEEYVFVPALDTEDPFFGNKLDLPKEIIYLSPPIIEKPKDVVSKPLLHDQSLGE